MRRNSTTASIPRRHHSCRKSTDSICSQLEPRGSSACSLSDQDPPRPHNGLPHRVSSRRTSCCTSPSGRSQRRKRSSRQRRRSGRGSSRRCTSSPSPRPCRRNVPKDKECTLPTQKCPHRYQVGSPSSGCCGWCEARRGEVSRKRAEERRRGRKGRRRRRRKKKVR